MNQRSINHHQTKIQKYTIFNISIELDLTRRIENIPNSSTTSWIFLEIECIPHAILELHRVPAENDNKGQ